MHTLQCTSTEVKPQYNWSHFSTAQWVLCVCVHMYITLHTHIYMLYALITEGVRRYYMYLGAADLEQVECLASCE